jgi:hypothetical protein
LRFRDQTLRRVIAGYGEERQRSTGASLAELD